MFWRERSQKMPRIIPPISNVGGIMTRYFWLLMLPATGVGMITLVIAWALLIKWAPLI